MAVAREQSQDVGLSGGTILRFEPFDSKHLGAPSYALVAPPELPSLHEPLVALQTWLAAKPCFALVTARPANAEQRRELAQAGFRNIETSLTFGRPLDSGLPSQADARIGLATSVDELDCVALGGRAFVTDRFHRDPAIPKTAADALKADWVRNSLRGRADRCFVARQGDDAVGFNLCMARNDTAWIDLIAVDTAHRRKGLARALVEAAMVHYRDRGFVRLHVKTQADNAASIALYEQCGFALIERSFVCHLTPSR
jgi:ribosomal protein S18 acetylase RimI-like enzyme